jgi:hypothetical protein
MAPAAPAKNRRRSRKTLSGVASDSFISQPRVFRIHIFISVEVL